MTIYRGVGGVNREIKQQFRGVGGVNREIKEQYRGVGGVNRKVFSKSILIPLEQFQLFGGATISGQTIKVYNSTTKVQYARIVLDLTGHTQIKFKAYQTYPSGVYGTVAMYVTVNGETKLYQENIPATENIYTININYSGTCTIDIYNQKIGAANDAQLYFRDFELI